MQSRRALEIQRENLNFLKDYHMKKMQELALARLKNIKDTWRIDNHDSAQLEAVIETGRDGLGYTDDWIGKLAKLFDKNGKLSFAQMQNIRARLAANPQATSETPEKVKRKYTKRSSV